MRSKMRCSLEEVGTRKTRRLVDRAGGRTRKVGNLQVDSLGSSMRGLGGALTRVYPLKRKCKTWPSIDHHHCAHFMANSKW